MPASPRAEFAEAGARAHAASFQLFTTATSKGKFREEQDASFFVTGLPSNTFNGAILFGDLVNPEDLFQRTQEYCSAAKVPWSLSLRKDVAERVKTALESKGMREYDREPALVLPSLEREPPPLPPGLSIRRARRPEEVGVFLVTMARGFGLPGGALYDFYRPTALKRLVDDPRTAWFVGFAEGRPVATAMSIAVGDLSSVSMVSTVPSHRKKGFGEALTWRATLAGRERGCRVAFLRATEMGEPVYRKMGFVDVEGYRSFASPGLGALYVLRTVVWLLGVSLWFAVRGRRLRKAPWASPAG